MSREHPMPTARPGTLRFRIEHWQALWASPHPDLAARAVTPDVTVLCPGDSGPVAGITQYREKIARLLHRVPDLRREAIDHADNGEVLFVEWIAHGTGAHEPFEFSGIDRIRLRDGLIKDHRIYFDPAWLNLL